MISQPNGRFGCVRFGILRAMLIERAASRSTNGDSNMQVKQDHNPVIICRSCGADYSAKLPNCPYCGTMNLPAAEQAYMNKLENMRSDLEGLGGLAGRQAKKGFRSMRRKMLIAAMLLCLAAALLYGLHLRREKAETQREKAEFLWQRTAFAEMDAYYASGDYESLLQLYYDAQDAGHHVWQYRHSSFCEFLMKIEIAKYSLREYEAGDGDLVCLLRDELHLYQLEDLPTLGMEERAELDRLRSPLLEDLDARFHLTEDEIFTFRKVIARDGWLSYEDCKRFLEERGA